MDLWMSYVQKGFKDLLTNPGAVDLVAFGSRAQQWLVVIHPFIDGNGRISRLMMDYILNQFHLPVPTLDDMDMDFFASPEQC